ncbi:MAG: hypothetical protein AABX74_04640, partial [Nanoarchaeota archaeon]
MRDFFQSKLANKVASLDQIAMAGLIADAIPPGYAVEQDGGGFFEGSVIRGEDPYALLEKLSPVFEKAGILRTSLHRSQNIVSLGPHSDEVVGLYTELILKPLVDIVDIFDSCNFLPNMETAYRSALGAGLIVSGNVCFDPPAGESVADTVRKMAENARGQKAMGAHMLRVKDMIGILTREYVEAICEEFSAIGLPFGFHSHDILGVGVEDSGRAMDLGAQFVSTGISTWSGGNGHPSTESVYINNRYRFPSLDRDKLIAYARAAGEIRAKYGMLDSHTDVPNLSSSVLPGGMVGPLLAQMDELRIPRERFTEIVSLVGLVRKEARQRAVRVTPVSQIIGVMGIRYFLDGGYRLLSEEARLLLQGWYGPIDGEVTGQLAQEHPELKNPKYNLHANQIPDGLRSVIEANIGQEEVTWQGEQYKVH